MNTMNTAVRRLESLKNTAKKHSLPSWREARKGSRNIERTLCAGTNGTTPVWYTHSSTGWREKFADEVEGARVRHTGWYADPTMDNLVRGIVVALPHGKFIAGYHMSDSGESVYFDEVHTDEVEAAQMADEHARVVAESEMEYQSRWQEASSIECEIDDAFRRLRECIALRHNPCMQYIREEVSEIAARIRSKRDLLMTEYAGVL